MSILYVKKEAPVQVSPSEPMPTGNLPLSVLDRWYFLRHVVEVIMVFDHGKEPAQVIREALAKALVPYYPVAGRIATMGDGELGVACTGEGVWFVEASADCRLEEVDYLSRVPFNFSKEQLLPSLPGIDETALPFLMQVTQFKCGGFVVGVKFNHAFFDGAGAGQFVAAIGEMARGLGEPTVKPVWCRDILRCPLPRKPPDSAQPVEYPKNLTFCAIDIPMDCVDRQKEKFVDATGQKCTTFDLVAAKLWQSRTRAINLPRDANINFYFLTNIGRLHEMLPLGDGYYGNCIYSGWTATRSERIANATLFDVVRIVQDTKQSLPTKFLGSLMGEDAPQTPSLSYGDFAVFDLRRLGFYEADFGWGEACHVVRLSGHEGISGAARIMKSPPSKTGIRVTAHCVAAEHHEAFLKEMHSWP